MSGMWHQYVDAVAKRPHNGLLAKLYVPLVQYLLYIVAWHRPDCDYA